MSSPWPLVPLGEVLRHRKEFVRINDLETYKRVRVQLHAKGIVLRDVVSGAEIKTKEQQVCRAREFLVAEIDAKVGGFGVIPDELAGSIVSSHYFLFEINKEKLDSRFLDYFVRTPFFRDQVAARGSTNYAAIRPHHVMEYQIPLPRLSEQRWIVARIEELAAKINRARALRQQAAEETRALLHSRLGGFFESACKVMPRKTIGSFTAFDRYGPRFYNEPYSENGTPIVRATDISDRGQIDFSTMPRINLSLDEVAKLKIAVGDLLVVRSGSIGLSAVFSRAGIDCIPGAYLIQFRFDATVDSDYVRYCLQVPSIQRQLIGRGTTVQNLNARKIKETEIPFPPLPEQLRIVAELNALQEQIDALKRFQAANGGELDAVLPSILNRAFKGDLR